MLFYSMLYYIIFYYSVLCYIILYYVILLLLIHLKNYLSLNSDFFVHYHTSDFSFYIFVKFYLSCQHYTSIDCFTLLDVLLGEKYVHTLLWWSNVHDFGWEILLGCAEVNSSWAFWYYVLIDRVLYRLCILVVRVLGYRSGGPGSIPGTIRKKK
jgi:hypothetical protein